MKRGEKLLCNVDVLLSVVDGAVLPSDGRGRELRETRSGSPSGDRYKIRSQPVIRRKSHRGAAKSAERQERREQQFTQILDECGGPEDVSPEWLAKRVGVPVGCAEWYLASLVATDHPKGALSTPSAADEGC